MYLRLKGMLIDCWERFHRFRVLDQSAKLAFYFLLSIFPLLIFFVMLLGMLLQAETNLQETIFSYISSIAPAVVFDLIKNTMNEITSSSSSIKLSLILVFAWGSATQAMLAIIDEMNIFYELEEARRWWKKYLIASFLTMSVLLLNTLSMMILIYGLPVAKLLMGMIGLGDSLTKFWSVLQWPLLFLQVLIVYYLIYRFGPNIKRPSGMPLIPGTIVGVVSWLLVSFGFKIYLQYFDSFSIIYGSIGAVIILMMWFYLTGASILTGAIVNSVYWHRGSKIV